MTDELPETIVGKVKKVMAGPGTQIIRILHLTASNFYGGPERQIIGQARSLAPSRFAVTIAAFAEWGRDTELISRAKDEHLTAETIPTTSAYDPWAPRRVSRLIKRWGAEIVVTHNYRSNLIGRWAARSCKIKHIAVSRGWTTENLKVRFYHWLDRRTLGRSDLVICVAQNKKVELLATGVPEHKLLVIPNAVVLPQPAQQPVTDWRAKYGWEPTSPLIISAGRLSSEKGPDVLLDAVPLILIQLPSAKFILFGDGPLAGLLRRRVEQAGWAKAVRLAGHHPDLSRELSAFDLLVNPSRSEGMPNIVLEAMATRLPVVATAVGGVGELIADGETGRLTEPESPSSLAQAVVETLRDRQRAMDRATRAYEMVCENFSFAAQACVYEKVYRRLAGGE